ncbi:MAG: dihydroorotase [Calditrichaeota bacterium]|nr:MAG: dihydroorotase [Calditrichota bacterium]
MNFAKTDNLLLAGGEIIDIKSGKHEKVDIVIQNGKIDKIGAIEKKGFNGQIIDASGCIITPGLMDMHVHLREPGREDKETIDSGCAAATAGGFTAVACMPNTTPVCDTQEVVRFIKKKAEKLLVDVFPVAAITKGRQGKEITEMAELIREGAVAFSDDGSPVADTAVMRNAMDYVKMFDVPIIDHCEDPFLAQGGHMNEGVMSTKLGMQGIPNAAESLQIERDIQLSRLTGARVHIAHLSVREGVELIRRAKDEGLPITAEVAPHHLMFSDQDLVNYDTHLKMNPPLRTPEDIAALEKGIKEGVIDVFASDHAPHTIEEKDVEFDAAPFGILGLETMLAIILKQIVNRNIISLHQALEKLTIAPRRILNLPLPEVKEGYEANLTLINLNEMWTYDVSNSRSKSRNAPYNGMTFQGKAVGVFNRGLFESNFSQ